MDVSSKKVFLEKILFVLIAIYIAIIPFSFLTAIEGFSFYLSILTSIILIFVFKKKVTFITPLSIPFLLFVVWVFIGLFFARSAKVFSKDTNMSEIFIRKDRISGLGWNNDRGVIRVIEDYFVVKFNKIKYFSKLYNGWPIRRFAICNGFMIIEENNEEVFSSTK